MLNRKEYTIPFVGLSLGEHIYEYKIEGKFFDDFEFLEIHESDISLKISLLKQSSMMVLMFDIKGTVQVECDRCTDTFNLPIEGTYKLIVKVGGADTGNDDDDIITIAANDYELDLTQYIYEYISLSLPIKRVHPDNNKGESTCNKEMLEKLSTFLTEEDKEESEPTTDPRWDDLKNITLN